MSIFGESFFEHISRTPASCSHPVVGGCSFVARWWKATSWPKDSLPWKHSLLLSIQPASTRKPRIPILCYRLVCLSRGFFAAPSISHSSSSVYDSTGWMGSRCGILGRKGKDRTWLHISAGMYLYSGATKRGCFRPGDVLPNYHTAAWTIAVRDEFGWTAMNRYGNLMFASLAVRNAIRWNQLLEFNPFLPKKKNLPKMKWENSSAIMFTHPTRRRIRGKVILHQKLNFAISYRLCSACSRLVPNSAAITEVPFEHPHRTAVLL